MTTEATGHGSGPRHRRGPNWGVGAGPRATADALPARSPGSPDDTETETETETVGPADDTRTRDTTGVAGVAPASGDGAILSEVSIASASASESRHHPTRAANGRYVRPAVDPDNPQALPADRFLDREISWLQFNERVLQLAADDTVPLLERARYLAIFASNLDEFFMVRVAGLKRRIATGIAMRSASGLEPREVLEQVSVVAHELMALHARVYGEQVRPALEQDGVTIVRWDELADTERDRLAEVFSDRVFPVLTPLAVDPAHPFPYISGLSLNLAVILVNPRTGKEHFARIKVPPLLPRLLRVEPGPEESPLADMYDTRFVPLEDVIAAHLDQLFPGMDVREHFTFRVTRNEDLEVEEDDAENLLTALERELTRRRFGPPVRLEVEADMDDHVLDLIVRELGVTSAEVYRLPAPLDLRALDLIADLERSELHFELFLPRTNPELAPTESSQARDIFAAIRKQDVLLHHPYDSFSTSVQALLEQAAADPRVLAIKQTLYRTSGDSPIVDALIDAAEAGKQVLAVVEIKARFDEENNISWARKLEQAGVHVVYGIVGLKTHAKLCLVIRQEPEGLRRYCHVGTGNYNPKTARHYEDLGLLSDDPHVGEDLTRLFNQLSGIAPRSKFKRLLVAPRSVRSGLMTHIENEIEHERAAPGSGYVAFKVNSIVDEHLIDALYRAARAGVTVHLWVRGICALRPGVPELSETIEVRSVLGRFLEHSRVFYFGGGGDPVVYIGSADLMHRNLDRRVEALVRLTDPRHVDDLRSLLARGMDDAHAHWRLGPDGRWTRAHVTADGAPLADLQAALVAMHDKRRRKARRR
jgi:polyphosphate kinase